ncbi:hypothetical protein CCHR01_17368 [Colletotrichum chrysophilum]|uniref:Carboxymuconolactone decarboxylase n=1 Tax=Colletotrichum chrysophilum TaxID=1836956 RepID=A0AAD9A287_9PEZI|nr:hypothetical protein CCHR01_17368 [Colletotrichum chrysophilum]
MSNTAKEFNDKYINANLATDASHYDETVFHYLVRHLELVDGGAIAPVAPGIIAAMLCAQRRGDAVPKLFHDLAKVRDVEGTKILFASFKLALDLTWPFTGLPQCIPACLGLIGELREFDFDWFKKGVQTNEAIYRAVGNEEVHRMMGGVFPEISQLVLSRFDSSSSHLLAYIANVAVFGFLVGGSERTQSLPLCEITIAGAIAALGATRQAKSHLKGSMGLGISVAVIEAVLYAAEQVAKWNDTKLPGKIDVTVLAKEVEANLGNLRRV